MWYENATQPHLGVGVPPHYSSKQECNVSPASLLDDRVRQGGLHHLQLCAGVAGTSLLQVPAPGRGEKGRGARHTREEGERGGGENQQGKTLSQHAYRQAQLLHTATCTYTSQIATRHHPKSRNLKNLLYHIIPVLEAVHDRLGPVVRVVVLEPHGTFRDGGIPRQPTRTLHG